MRIAITGSTGRVGRAIYVRLSRYHDVIGLDRAPSSTADIVADLGDQAALSRLLDGAEAVIHTAALHAPHVGMVPDHEFERINVQATERLLNACLKQGIERFVLTSTTAVYGAAAKSGSGAVWLDESVVPQPSTIYQRTKLKAEALLKSAADDTGLCAVALRMSRCFPEPVDLMAVYRLHRGIDARDVASAHQFALEEATPGYSHYVVSGGTPFRQEDCASLGNDAARMLAWRAPGLVREFETRGWHLPPKIDRVCVSDALISQGWVPQYGYDEVLRQFDQESSEVLIAARFVSNCPAE